MRKLFTKAAAGIVGIALAVGVGVAINSQKAVTKVRAVEIADKVCDFTTKASSNGGYGVTWTYDTDYEIFGGANNNGNWAYVSFGAKKGSGESEKVTEAYVKTINTSIPGDITSVSFKVTTARKYGGTVVASLEVASDASFETIIDTVDYGTVSQDTAAIHRIIPSTGTSWGTDKYFKLNLTCTNTTTSNGMISLENVSFNKESAAIAPEAISCDSQSVDVTAKLDLASKVTFTPATTTERGLSFTIKEGAEYIELNSNGVVTGVKSGSATITVTPNDTSAGATAIDVAVTINAIDLPGVTVGEQYVIYANDEEHSAKFELTGIDSNLGQAAEFDTIPACTYVLTAEEGYFENTISFKDADDKYLGITDDSNNYLKALDSNTANTSWIVSWDNNTEAAVITNAVYTARKIKFNYNSGNSRFATYKSDQVSICLYHYVEKALENFTIQSELDVYKTGTAPIHVTYTPADAADKELNWSSADENIATVDNNGVVTGVAVGQTIITASKTIDGVLVERTCEVSVLNNVSTHRGSDVDPFDINDAVQVAKGVFVEDPDGTPISLEYYYYIEGTITANVTRTRTNLSFWLGDDPSQVSAATGAFEVYKVMSIYGTAIGTYYSNDNQVVRDFNVGNKIQIYSKIVYFQGTTPETVQNVANIRYNNYIKAREYAEQFNNSLSSVCDASGNTNLEDLQAMWSIQANYFADAIDDDARAVLTNATASSSESATAVEQCAAKYDYIAGKYNTQLGAEFDFMGRNPAPIGDGANYRIDSFNENRNSTLTVVMISIASVGIVSLGVLLVIKKRKQN